MEPKSWYQSRTVWGGLIALAGGVAGAFGYGIGEAEQVELVDAATAIAAAVGGGAAIWGRVNARARIAR
ncbi:MAG: hypothetical protein HQL38_01330 [Alphaproteobacteria bacterium]|nr:hypothetical protein [Alphaproteobacteria bacterium]MBF0391297.1 hypothetical protein [Alphaproteobacteria bacterium]